MTIPTRRPFSKPKDLRPWMVERSKSVTTPLKYVHPQISKLGFVFKLLSAQSLGLHLQICFLELAFQQWTTCRPQTYSQLDMSEAINSLPHTSRPKAREKQKFLLTLPSISIWPTGLNNPTCHHTTILLSRCTICHIHGI